MTLVVKQITEVPEFAQLRDWDEIECHQAAGLEGHEAMSRCIEQSTRAYAAFADGELVAAWGYATPSLLSFSCDAWMLSTPVIENHKREVARISFNEVRKLLTMYSAVHVIVHKDYALARRWLKKLGFHPFEHSGNFVEMWAHKDRIKGFKPWVF